MDLKFEARPEQQWKFHQQFAIERARNGTYNCLFCGIRPILPFVDVDADGWDVVKRTSVPFPRIAFTFLSNIYRTRFITRLNLSECALYILNIFSLTLSCYRWILRKWKRKRNTNTQHDRARAFHFCCYCILCICEHVECKGSDLFSLFGFVRIDRRRGKKKKKEKRNH